MAKFKSKVGQFVSVWERPSKRHKWRLMFGFVYVAWHRLEDWDKRPTIAWRCSDTGTYSNPCSNTVCMLGTFRGGFQRKIGKPDFKGKKFQFRIR